MTNEYIYLFVRNHLRFVVKCAFTAYGLRAENRGVVLYVL